ncbi:MAG: hypothetical protein E6Q32_06640 [Neisseriales bacterium]|nr:MAG: hypothetical protein E6Q32_06640 [Neisseriales bacterium]
MSRSVINRQNSVTQIELINTGNNPRVSTLEIAKHTKLSHRVVIRLVRKYQSEFEELEQVNFQSSLNPQGSPTIYALLTEQHTMFLYTLFRNITPEIVRFKLNLTKRFYQLKELLINRKNAEWQSQRSAGKIVTKSMTELFTQALDYCGKSHESQGYINLQQAIYKAALGKTAQALRKERNIPKHKTVRDYLNRHELGLVTTIQNMAEHALYNVEVIDDAQILRAIDNAGSALKLVANSLFLPRVA